MGRGQDTDGTQSLQRFSGYENTDPSWEQDATSSIHQSPSRGLVESRPQGVAYASSLIAATESHQQRHVVEHAAADTDVQAVSCNVEHASGNTAERIDHQSENVDNSTRDHEALKYNVNFDRDQDSILGSLTTQPLDPIDHYGNSSGATTKIHPIVVVYQGAEISLFRPASGDRDFILEDESLAGESIADLLNACRPILGEDVSEQELVLRMDDLDLEIYEVSMT